MEWIKGIKQLHTAKNILEGIEDEIVAGSIGSAEEIQKRIGYVQSALEVAKNHFTEESG